MIFKNNITILIPAAGEGTRSKLKYPKNYKNLKISINNIICLRFAVHLIKMLSSV